LPAIPEASTEPRSAVRRYSRWFVVAGILASLALVIVIVIVERSSADPATIRVINPGGGTAGGEMPNVPNGKAFFVDTYAVCTPTGEPVAITSVDPVNPTGPVKVDWAVHHGPFGGQVDVGIGPLDLPGFSHQPVTGKCNADPNAPHSFSMIAFSIQAVRGGPVAVQAFRLHFEGGSVIVPFSVETCPTKHCPKFPGIG
jgi:hypothetical protein